MAFYFDHSVHKCDWLRIVNHWEKCDNSVLFAENKNKVWFKIASDEDRWQCMDVSFFKEKSRTLVDYCHFVNFCEIKV